MTFADMMFENVQLFSKSLFFGAIICQIIVKKNSVKA